MKKKRKPLEYLMEDGYRQSTLQMQNQDGRKNRLNVFKHKQEEQCKH